MKAIGTLLLVALLFLSSGCMTYYAVAFAKGDAGEVVKINSSDQIIQYDGTNCVIKRISPKGKTNKIRLSLITSDTGYVCKPAYYALLPLTIPADIATLPFQLIFFMVAPVG